MSIFLLVVFLFSQNGVFALETQETCEQEKSYIVLLEEPALYSENRPVPYRINKEEYEEDVREYLTSLQDEIKEKIPQNISMNVLKTYLLQIF